jgi:hypothetical protein
MSGCALRRWGSGTPCTKEPDTAAKKEMANALATMMAERERQDTMWNPPQEVAVKEVVKSTTTPHKRAEILRPQ